jgi:hypothetical protein
MRWHLIGILALSLVAAAPQEKKAAPKGELKPGEELPGTFQPYNLNGRFRGRFHCLVCEHGLNPVAAVFVRGTDDLQGLTAFLQALDAAVKKNEKSRLAAFAIFVDEQLPNVVGNDEKREELAKKLDDLAGKLDKVTVALASKKDLEKYPFAPDAEVTLLLYNKLKIVEARALTRGKLTKDAIPSLVNEIVSKLTGQKRQ